MSRPSRHVTSATTLAALRREAKRWLHALREHGLPGWSALRARVAAHDATRRHEQVADALLSGIDTLESVTFDSCAGLTDAGIAAPARLPRLREVRVSGMAEVTPAVRAAFGAAVRVAHEP